MSKTTRDLAQERLSAAVQARRFFPRGGYEGLDATGLQVLLVLSLEPDRSVGEIADQLLLTHSSTSHALSLLSERGLVERVSDPTDGRAQRNRLTGPGRALLERYLQRPTE
jgi:DNA-binding MarR family transcriptional regulator